MSLKQLVLGASYAKIRSPVSQETHRYTKMIQKLQKSYIDTMNHRRRHNQQPYTIPIFLHRNDIKNQNFNLRKIEKVIMKDMFLPEDEVFEFKFVINERYIQRKHISPEVESSFRLMLNKISDRPVNLKSDYKYNRSNEIGLYVKSNFSRSIIPVTPSDHKDLLQLLSTSLTENFELVNVPKQFYVQFELTHSKLSNTLRDSVESVTRWKEVESGNESDVVLNTLELADEVVYVGIHPGNDKYEELVNKKLINPATSREVRIVEADDYIMKGVDKNRLLGITPNHVLIHREFCESKNLKFNKISEYDLHSSPYLRKKTKFEQIFNVVKTAPPAIPIILSPTSIRNKSTEELFEITKYSVIGYINLVEELKTSVAELLLSTKRNAFPGFRPYPLLSILITEEFWLSFMVLKAMGLQNKFKIVEVSKVIDFKERDVSKLRPDFNKHFNGVPVDHVCEKFNNSNALFEDDQYPVKSDSGAISIDLIRGMLLTLDKKHGGVIFDDSHKTAELLKLTLLLDLFNNYSIKFMRNGLKNILLDIGFKNLIGSEPNYNFKEWNYFFMSKMIKDMRKFVQAKEDGDIAEMQRIFSELLVLITNGYWDLLNSEIMLASKKPQTLPRSKVYLKHLMGTVVYYMHIMGQNFYINEGLHVLKKLPLLRSKYDINLEFDKFDENLEVYKKNIDDLQNLNPQLRNYLKVYDNDVLDDGSMIINLVSRLKEVLLSKRKSTDIYSVIIEVQDMLKFVKVQEHQNNINVIYSIFKTKNIKNRMLKIVQSMNTNHIRFNQPKAIPEGIKTFAVTNGVSIHLVKDATMDRKVDELDANDIADMVEQERELNNRTDEKVTFKDVMIPEELESLLKDDNSQFDRVFEDIFDIESKKQVAEFKEEAEKLNI